MDALSHCKLVVARMELQQTISFHWIGHCGLFNVFRMASLSHVVTSNANFFSNPLTSAGGWD
jgi:hypothetical protein